MKKTLTATTPHGTFTRKTATPYTHIVVRKSPRAERVAEEVKAGKESNWGVYGRWAKDKGFITSWHQNEGNAEKAAAKPCDWDANAVTLGVYAVDSVGKALTGTTQDYPPFGTKIQA